MRVRNKLIAAAMTAAAAGISLTVATPAMASAGTCYSEMPCLFYNSGYQGATFSDDGGNSMKPENYGAPNYYTFNSGSGLPGYGVAVKNNAASVFDYDDTYSVTIYYNSNNTGPSQYFQRGTGGNLNSSLKNENASQCMDFYGVCP